MGLDKLQARVGLYTTVHIVIPMALLPGHLKLSRKTIWIRKDLKDFLDSKKLFWNETYDDCLRRLLKVGK